MHIGFCIGMDFMAFSGHINVMVFAGAAISVVRIQTFGAIWIGKLVTDALHICNEHFEVILHIKLQYRRVGLLMVERVW